MTHASLTMMHPFWLAGLFVLTSAQYSEYGGAPCQWNVQCGPLPDTAKSEVQAGVLPRFMTGYSGGGFCNQTSKTCVCTHTDEAFRYGCGSCSNRAATKGSGDGGLHLHTTTFQVDRQSSNLRDKTLDVCSMSVSGGGSCTQNSECMNGGMCIIERPARTGFCVCVEGYTCPYCTTPIQDFSYGARCPSRADNGTLASNGGTTAISGGASCSTNGDCGKGLCELGRCKCVAGVGCPTCSHEYVNLVKDPDSNNCGCAGVKCPDAANSNGYCGGGGQCVCYFPFVGPDCGTNPCVPDGKNNICKGLDNTECVISEDSVASCECTGGFTRTELALRVPTLYGCKVPPTCKSDADCGDWSGIEGKGITGLDDPCRMCRKDPQGCATKSFNPASYAPQECRYYGGTCSNVTGRCTCKSGFGCSLCDAQAETGGADPPADECNAATGSFQTTGGGLCAADIDCGPKNAKGGVCLKPSASASTGRCVCNNGFTCSHCSHVGQVASAVPGGCPLRSSKDDIINRQPTPPPTRAPTRAPNPAPLKDIGGLGSISLREAQSSVASHAAVPSLAVAALGAAALLARRS